jgi:hypothetical protein
VLALTAAVSAIALWTRFAGLGERPLSVDEYYFVSSARAVLEHGLPQLAGGGLYTRGLLAQYGSAGIVTLFGDSLWSWRLLFVLCGLAVLPATYFYARSHVSRAVALAMTITLALSSWEIEFSRFARMYAPFQLLSVLMFFALDRTWLAQRRRASMLPIALGLASYFTHELGLLLLPWLALASGVFLMRDVESAEAPPKWVLIAGPAVLLGCAALDLLLPRWTDVEAPFPDDYELVPLSPLRQPSWPFFGFSPGDGLDALVTALLSISALAGAAAWVRWRRTAKWDPLAALSGAAVAAAALHLLTLAALGVLVLVRQGRVSARRSLESGAVVAAIALSVLWLTAGVITDDWRTAFASDAVGNLGAWRRTFFGWPDLFTPLVDPWVNEMPRLTLLLAIGLAFEGWRVLGLPLRAALRSPVAPLALIAIEFGVLASDYTTTRYSFFLYPIGLTASFVALSRGLAALAPHASMASRELAVGTLGLTLFATTEDLRPEHWWRIRSEQVTYRTGPFRELEATWYPRWDFRTPAARAAELAAPDEPILVAGVPVCSAYLTRPHAIFFERSDARFSNVSRAHGTRDRWSGSRLLSTPAELESWLAGRGRVWVLRSAAPASSRARALDLPSGAWAERVVSRGVDDRVELVEWFRIPRFE